MEREPMNDLVALATIFVLVGLPCLTVAWCKFLKYKERTHNNQAGSPGDGFTMSGDPDGDVPPPTDTKSVPQTILEGAAGVWAPPTPPPPPIAHERWSSDPTRNPIMKHAEGVHVVPGLRAVES